MFYKPAGLNFCGGTIFSETVIVTAAHCCYGVAENFLDWADFEVVAGELNLDITEGTEQRRAIADHIPHPQYSSSTLENDVCLLFLANPLDLSGPNAKSLPLATKDPEVGSPCIISGWGATDVSKERNIYQFL